MCFGCKIACYKLLFNADQDLVFHHRHNSLFIRGHLHKMFSCLKTARQSITERHRVQGSQDAFSKRLDTAS